MENTSDIEWRVCARFPIYEVNNRGDVRRWKVVRGKPPAIVRSYICGGYRRYRLREGGRYHNPFAHQLVAEAFIGPKPFDGAEVCHNRPDKLNVSPDNLRWDTHAANMTEKRAQGVEPLGVERWNAKLNEEAVREIRRRLRDGEKHKDIAKDFGVATNRISYVKTGRSWSHVI